MNFRLLRGRDRLGMANAPQSFSKICQSALVQSDSVKDWIPIGHRRRAASLLHTITPYSSFSHAECTGSGDYFLPTHLCKIEHLVEVAGKRAQQLLNLNVKST